MTTNYTLSPPPPLRMDNAFAHETMARRLPAIIRQTQAANPDYPPGIRRALDRLHDALIADEPIPMLDALPVPPPDYAEWDAAYRAQQVISQPLTWQHSEWFFAETYFYRRLMQEVRWFETRRDPFAPIKDAELHNERLWRLLAGALQAEGTLARLSDRLLAALWGNRVDLSHPAGDLTDDAAEDDLLVDHRSLVAAYLADGVAAEPAAIHLVLDNAGVELAMDLALADLLLMATRGPVTLHLKVHPTYVSDATIDDVWRVLAAMEGQGGPAGALAGRLWAAWAEERLRLAAHPFWNSSRFLWDMPEPLRAALGQARLVVLKGDVNYRRAVGDALWDPALSFHEIMRFFPAPLLALRSIKSDPLVGAPIERTRHLDATRDGWRVTGRYGVIEFAGPKE